MVIIISTTTAAEQKFWKKRLPKAVVVLEEWEAGNGLGTLAAYQQASKQVKIQDDDTVFLYHTAGRGKRLYPLVGSEGGNKSAVQLPMDGKTVTLLEAVVKQTRELATARKGRLSVFWGDQIFLPSIQILEAAHHIDILGKFGVIPDPAYGTLTRDTNGNASLFEKRTPNTSEETGLSLGCFSLSQKMLRAFLKEFTPDIRAKKKMDSDPHFWMPATLPKNVYVELGHDGYHYDRMQKFYSQFSENLFGATDIGKDAHWWDFGTTQNYTKNLLAATMEGDALGKFLRLQKNEINSSYSGTAEGCLLVNVNAEHLNIKNSVLINCNVRSVSGEGCLLYNIEGSNFNLPPETVVSMINGEIFSTSLNRDGKEDWNQKLPGNPCCFASCQTQNAQ